MSSRNRERGFSLLEMMVVVLIMGVLAVVAVPSFIRGVAAVRLRSGASSVAGVMQEARMLAVRDNRTYRVSTTAYAGGIAVFVDLDRDGNLDTNEQGTVVMLPTNTTGTTTGAPSISNIGGINSYAPTAALPSFNPRGLPCSGTTTCATGAFIYYLQQTRPLGGVSWAAITITQAGRVRSFTWTGSEWN